MANNPRGALLVDCTILIIGDEPLISWDLEDAVRDAGSHAVHVAASLITARHLVQTHRPTAAILDFDSTYIRGGEIADMLAEADVPFVLLTVLSRRMLPARHALRTLVTKPYSRPELVGQVHKAMQRPDR